MRESDLLSAYDFDRCMIYNMNKKDGNVCDAFNDAHSLFENRVLKHNEDKLFLTDYARDKSVELHAQSLVRMNNWENVDEKTFGLINNTLVRYIYRFFICFIRKDVDKEYDIEFQL